MSMQRSGSPQSFNNRGVLPNRKGAKAAAPSYILDMFKRKAKAAWSLYAVLLFAAHVMTLAHQDVYV
ncbi:MULTISPECIES: hypothetical protein [Serratia]|uniref:hypothetical protein n=1 Tax=Serratia TaxID=613 RepID=UPI002406326E|nr:MULTISPECIES: hypothetical protein [Serratia]MDF9722578.1 hypothetical protein [Serratia marcescens]